MKPGIDTLNTAETLSVNGKEFTYFSLPKAEAAIGQIDRLPFSMKVLLENLLRFEDGTTVTSEDVKAIATWLKDGKTPKKSPIALRAYSCKISRACLRWLIWRRCAMR